MNQYGDQVVHHPIIIDQKLIKAGLDPDTASELQINIATNQSGEEIYENGAAPSSKQV